MEENKQTKKRGRPFGLKFPNGYKKKEPVQETKEEPKEQEQTEQNKEEIKSEPTL